MCNDLKVVYENKLCSANLSRIITLTWLMKKKHLYSKNFKHNAESEPTSKRLKYS